MKEQLKIREAVEILEKLFEHCFHPQFVYHRDWAVGDLTFWDNRCVAHIADNSRLDDPGYVRHLHRTSIQDVIRPSASDPLDGSARHSNFLHRAMVAKDR